MNEMHFGMASPHLGLFSFNTTMKYVSFFTYTTVWQWHGCQLINIIFIATLIDESEALILRKKIIKTMQSLSYILSYNLRGLLTLTTHTHTQNNSMLLLPPFPWLIALVNGVVYPDFVQTILVLSTRANHYKLWV